MHHGVLDELSLSHLCQQFVARSERVRHAIDFTSARGARRVRHRLGKRTGKLLQQNPQQQNPQRREQRRPQ
jgi:hypothetical protein